MAAGGSSLVRTRRVTMREESRPSVEIRGAWECGPSCQSLTLCPGRSPLAKDSEADSARSYSRYPGRSSRAVHHFFLARQREARIMGVVAVRLPVQQLRLVPCYEASTGVGWAPQLLALLLRLHQPY
jgi:hypothetical protein